MNTNSELPQRKPTRYKGYDYTTLGMYFVTVCTQNHACALGKIYNDIVLTKMGQIAHACWVDLPNHYSNIELDKFVIMPNHVHGIITILSYENALREVLCQAAGVPSRTAPVKRYCLSEIVRGFKTFSTRRINQFLNTPGRAFWQRSFYDHIIRNDRDLQRIRQYIFTNPFKWLEDSLYMKD
ncbi:MAG: transposase [Anaerolineae bacterium]|nr:transposase [Anaerolineae bacterium]